jgi:C4-dicarboxylate-specific signal transduction histidine kinase
MKGAKPQEIDVDGTDDPALKNLSEAINMLLGKVDDANGFLSAISQGDLDADPPVRNFLASPAKQLHSNLRHLTWQTLQVAGGDLNQKVDFLGEFSDAFNSMIDSLKEKEEAERKLAEAQKQLLDTAHKAGMADIATGILHNFGNVLTSVNSSAEEIRSTVTNSKVQSFVKANELLKEHIDHIGEFLTDDERGKKLPEFYLKLGVVLQEENDKIQKNMNRIEDKIRTMKGIVETQQEFAKADFHSEREDIPRIIDDVLTIQKDLIESSGVHIAKAYQKPLRCKVHKYKLVQVLINLVKNAIESMNSNDFWNRAKELTIETGTIDEANDFVRVSDNGCGIPPENLVTIFNHGFTTKEKGHGFGLHASANAMTEMGGSISVQSDGEGKGASFIVTLPVKEEGVEAV